MVWSLAQARVVISDLKADYNRRRRHRIDFRASALGLRGAGPSGACPAHPASSDRRPGRAKSSEDSNAPEGRSRRSSRSSGAATACAWPMRSTRRAHPRLGCLVGATVPIASWDGTRADTGREVRRWGPLDRGHGSEAGRGVGATGVTPTTGVVVAVPDRRQLDLPPRSAGSLRDAHRRGPLEEWKRRAAGDSWAGWRPLASRPWTALPALFSCVVIHR